MSSSISEQQPVPAMGSNRRRGERLQLERPVRLQFAGCDEVEAVTANLSSGGLFVKTKTPPPVGTRVRFVIDLGDRAIRGYAEVAWIRARFPGPDRPRGMGLSFVFILDDGVNELEKFLARARAAAAD